MTTTTHTVDIWKIKMDDNNQLSLRSLVANRNLLYESIDDQDGKGGEAEIIGDKLKPSYKLTVSHKDNEKLKPYPCQISNGTRIVLQSNERLRHLGYYSEFAMKSKRERILVLSGDVVVAMADFKIYKNSSRDYLSLDDFFYECDADSDESCHFSESAIELFETIPKRYISPEETLVEFSMLRVSKEFKGRGLWADAVNSFISTRYKGKNFTHMFLWAFPTQYSGLLTDDLPLKNRQDYERRRDSMLRFYKRELKVTQISDTDWMYKRL